MSLSALGLLAKLNPKSSDWSAIPGSCGPSITPSDIAAALAENFGLSKQAQILGFYLVGKSEAYFELRSEIAKTISLEALMTGLELSDSIAGDLAHTVLLEFMSRSKCKRCNGAGKCFKPAPDITKRAEGAFPGHSVTRRYETCPSCMGGGVKRWSDYRQAKEAGMNDRTYVRRYRHVRATGYRAVGSWLTELNTHLLEQFHMDDPTS